MKIALPDYDQSAVGGGWSFLANFNKSFANDISPYGEAEIYFIPSASMVSRDDVAKAKADGKKIVLRADNIIRNSRNRNTGMTRMKDFSDWADLVIFQSKFAESLLNPYLQTENYQVILNSADESIFYPRSNPRPNVYLYSRYSSDETKNWEMARVAFQEIHSRWAGSELYIIGRPDMSEYSFDFYNGERYKYWGLITDRNALAEIYSQCDKMLYTYFNDACSNTAIEAMLCGVEIVDCFGMIGTGGTPEIIAKYFAEGKEYFHLERMAADYRRAFNELV